MKLTTFAVFCLTLLLVSGCGQKVDDPADAEAIRQLISEYGKAETENNVDWFRTVCYLDDAERMPPNQAVVAGKDAIVRQMQANYDANTSIVMTIDTDKVYSSGDLAVARGNFSWQGTPKAAGLAKIDMPGKWVATYQRQQDGSWKCIFDIWNSNLPTPGATEDGAEEAALYQIERDWLDAAVNKDRAKLDAILAKDYVGKGDDGTRNKSQSLARITGSGFKIESAAIENMQAMVFGETAIVHGVNTGTAIIGGKTYTNPLRWTDVFEKRDGRWQAVVSYSTEVK